MTLGCAVLYRRRGVGSALLRFSLELAKSNKCVSVKLHVHSSNSDAVAFYEKFGFTVKGEIGGYYRYLDPSTALLLERRIEENLT